MTLFYFRHLSRLVFKPLFFLLSLLGAGTAGYITLEEWNVLDSLYMTVITITTVGFAEVQELSSEGRAFTIFLILGGVILYALSLNVMVQIVAERKFQLYFLEVRMLERIEHLRNHFIIAGGGRMGYAIAEELELKHQDFVILDTHEESICAQAIRNGRKKNWTIINRDAKLEESLIEARIEYARGIAVVLPSDADNLFVVLSTRSLNKQLQIETRIINDNVRDKMIQAGADKVLSPYNVSGVQMARSLINPEIDSLMQLSFGKQSFEFEIKSHEVTEDDEIDGKTIRETGFSKEGLMILGIRNPDGSFKFSPGPDFRLQKGQQVILFGN